MNKNNKNLDTQAINFINTIKNIINEMLVQKLDNNVNFTIGTVVTLDSSKGVANVKVRTTDNLITEGEDFTNIDCAIKTEENISIGDTVVIFYVKNIANAFIFCKYTSDYDSRALTKDGMQFSTGDKIFQNIQVDKINGAAVDFENLMPTFSLGNYNCNNCYDAGLYQISQGINCPSNEQYGSLLVLTYRKIKGNQIPDFCTQIFIPNGDDSVAPNSLFYRTSLRNTWNNWQEINMNRLENINIKSMNISDRMGYIVYSSGLTIQWEDFDTCTAGDKNFPISFSSTNYAITVSQASSAPTTRRVGITKASQGKYHIDATISNQKWGYIAIGI